MCRRSPRMEGGRAIIGVVALYALLLQAFLGFALPARAVAGPSAVLCAEHGTDGPDGQLIPVHLHACCTLVQAGALALPASEPVALVRPRVPAARLAWRPEAELPRTGPPPRVGTARGPPAA